MKNKTPISKDHTEEIWMALLTMVEHSQKNVFETAKGLIAARRLLDQSISLQQAEKDLKDTKAQIRKKLEEAVFIRSLFTSPESPHTHESSEESKSGRAKTTWP